MGRIKASVMLVAATIALLVFSSFVKVPGSGREVTGVLLWRGGSDVVERHIEGDYRLHPGQPGFAWVVRNDLEPRLFEVPMAQLVELLH